MSNNDNGVTFEIVDKLDNLKNLTAGHILSILSKCNNFYLSEYLCSRLYEFDSEEIIFNLPLIWYYYLSYYNKNH